MRKALRMTVKQQVEFARKETDAINQAVTKAEAALASSDPGAAYDALIPAMEAADRLDDTLTRVETIE